MHARRPSQFLQGCKYGLTWCVAPSRIKDAEKESHDKQTIYQKFYFLGSLEIKIWNLHLKEIDFN